MDEQIKGEEQENTLSTELSGLPENQEEVVYIDKKSIAREKRRGDDVILTQCILCLILALSIFALRFISSDFQAELLSLYKERLIAPAEPFIGEITEAVEQWFKR